MKITGIETIQNTEYSNLVWIKLYTDEGLTGLGETFRNPQAIISYLHETCAPYLIGRDPLRINEHSDNLINWIANRYIGYPTRSVEYRGNSAVDIALWDLKSKACNLSLVDMLGGLSRDYIPIYNTCAADGYNWNANSLSRSVGSNNLKKLFGQPKLNHDLAQHYKKVIDRQCAIHNIKFNTLTYSLDHHLQHAACAMFNSGFKNAYCLIMDGSGTPYYYNNINIGNEIESIFYVVYIFYFNIFFSYSTINKIKLTLLEYIFFCIIVVLFDILV